MTPRYCGRWTLVRRISDPQRSEPIVCTGSAALRRDRAVLVYDEAVSYQLAGKRVAATRAYRFASTEDTIVATFADGSPFFTLRIEHGTGSATHVCGDDVYTLTLDLRERETWQTHWDVSGAKTLTIVTVYRRTAVADTSTALAPGAHRDGAEAALEAETTYSNHTSRCTPISSTA